MLERRGKAATLSATYSTVDLQAKLKGTGSKKADCIGEVSPRRLYQGADARDQQRDTEAVWGILQS